MSSGVVSKIQACADLIWMDLAPGAGFFLVAGEILALGGLPPLDRVLPGFLTLFFISGSANISNDYFDREVDRINLPARPSRQEGLLFRKDGSCFSCSPQPGALQPRFSYRGCWHWKLPSRESHVSII